MRTGVLVGFLAAGTAGLAAGRPLTGDHGSMDRPASSTADAARGAERDARAPVAGLSSAVSTAFDPAGRLWAAWVEGDQVLVSSSPDLGRSWATAVVAATTPTGVDANGEGRPKLAVGPRAELLVTFTEKLPQPYAGNVRFTRSVDGGRTFSTPITLNGDRAPTGHRFDTLVVSGERVTVAWIDKRDADRAKAEGRLYPGASLYGIVSNDAGATFLPERKLADNVCECCRIGGATGAAGETVLFYRGVFGRRTRDHALVSVGAGGIPGPSRRVTFDGWELDGCPHHGPALATGADGGLHFAWYTGEGTNGRGLFYARSPSNDGAIGSPERLTASGVHASHPAVFASGRDVVLAWLESETTVTRVFLKRSADRGATFSAPREVASTRGHADDPFLIRGPGGAFLSWFSDPDGLKVLPVTD